MKKKNSWGGKREGSGRPATGRTKSGISITQQTWDGLKRLSDGTGLSINQIADKLLFLHATDVNDFAFCPKCHEPVASLYNLPTGCEITAVCKSCGAECIIQVADE